MSTMRTLAAATFIAVFVLANLPAAFAGEWKKVLAATAVVIVAAVAGAVGYALGKATAQVDQIVREEVDEHRERDEFAMELRPEYRTPPTDTGETR